MHLGTVDGLFFCCADEMFRFSFVSHTLISLREFLWSTSFVYYHTEFNFWPLNSINLAFEFSQNFRIGENSRRIFTELSQNSRIFKWNSRKSNMLSQLCNVQFLVSVESNAINYCFIRFDTILRFYMWESNRSWQKANFDISFSIRISPTM